MKDNTKEVVITTDYADDNGTFGGITANAIKDALERPAAARIAAPVTTGDIIVSDVINCKGYNELWKYLYNLGDDDLAVAINACNVTKVKIIADGTRRGLRSIHGEEVAVINKFCVCVRVDKDWRYLDEFVLRRFGAYVPTALNWKTANDVAYIMRRGFVQKEGRDTFKRGKMTANELTAALDKAREEIAALKAQMTAAANGNGNGAKK